MAKTVLYTGIIATAIAILGIAAGPVTAVVFAMMSAIWILFICACSS